MKNKLGCELCSAPATTYCESDQARLCWHCDSKVHKANFLVGKHNRTLLCHLCQDHTPWTASGPILPPSLSVCISCASTTSSHAPAVTAQVQSPVVNSHHDENDGVYDSYDEEEDEDEDEGYESDLGNDVEEEEDDIQVVPLTSSVPPSSIAEDEDEDEDEHEHGDNINCNNNGDGRISSMLPSSMKRKRQFYLLS